MGVRTTGEDRRRFEDVYREHHGAVLAYARRRLPGCADEIVNRVFTVAWRRFDRVPLEQPLPWLYGIARNCVLDEQRAQNRRDRLQARVAALPAARVPQPCDGVEHRLEPRLDNVLQRLSPSDREVIELLAWEDLSVAELAVVLGCREGAARTRAHRARLRAQRLYDEPVSSTPDDCLVP